MAKNTLTLQYVFNILTISQIPINYIDNYKE